MLAHTLKSVSTKPTLKTYVTNKDESARAKDYSMSMSGTFKLDTMITNKDTIAAEEESILSIPEHVLNFEPKDLVDNPQIIMIKQRELNGKRR